MRNSNYFKNKKITIVGLARSGLACANLLYRAGAFVAVTDIKDNVQTQEASSKFCSKDILVELGKHSRDFIRDAELVVVSPGVPALALPIKWAVEFNKPLMSEIEIASILCPATIIAVTGSNGKTTVATLIGKILEASGRRVFVCGNIGNPFCSEVENMREEDFVVLEVSSFQLETIKDFKPKIAVILNLTPNHLDHYNNMQEYLDAKKRIIMNQDKDDFLVLNSQDILLKSVAEHAKSQVIFFSGQDGLNPNQSAVLTVGKILGINKDLVFGVFNKFKGIEHRMEEVRNINGIKFINDSKATTADSAIWAIKNIFTPIILIAGGRHKGIDYRVIIEPAKDKVKQAILIGEAKEIIALDLGREFPIEYATTLEDAVYKAYALAKPGYSVLFSPMCSSFDMFKDYEDRGRIFKKIVLDLNEDKLT
ncbi:MAG: UDP-N-acetylmuramoyl-L-alanine--D-glutamate ligase [Candidatus Omnitrophica bacterium]|nr:UDP-N-acetylmuramoyl-L-alanine--D-glutamate ligase [Candidatus Omnitrophota bacterium]